jgi:hypothetical protein
LALELHGDFAMTTEPRRHLEELKGRILGSKVSYCRLACDSLLLYVGCVPGDESGITLWFDPIWHLRGHDRVLLGSMQVAAVCDSEEAMAAVADGPLAPLLGRSIEGVAIAPLTFDLSVSLEGVYSVCTFVADGSVDESWHIRENGTGTRLKASPEGLSVQLPRAEAR